MINQPNYYAIIPADVRYDIKLKANAKLLYGEITALCGAQGFCWAQNDYFAALYGVNHKTISRWISQLEERGYIDVKVNKIQGNKRKISLVTKKSLPSDEKVTTLVTKKSLPSDEKVTSIYENITINNTSLIYKEKASEFLKVNYPSRFEQEFEMRFKKQFKTDADYNSFIEDFDLTWDGKDYPKNLFGELVKYAKNRVRYLNANQSNDDKVIRPEFKKIG
jgi:transposase